jgi:hypothetical protein
MGNRRGPKVYEREIFHTKPGPLSNGIARFYPHTLLYYGYIHSIKHTRSPKELPSQRGSRECSEKVDAKRVKEER